MLDGGTLTKQKWSELAEKPEPFDESSSRTYGRDVTFIRRALAESGDPHQVVTGPEMSYSLTSERKTRKLLPAVEMAEIVLAARALPRKNVEYLLQQLRSELAATEQKEFDDDIKLSWASYQPINQAEQVPTMVQEITAAIDKQQMLSFRYTPSNAVKPKPYRGQPFAMFFETHYFYTVMRMEKTDAVKMFRLDRIQGVDFHDRGRAIPHNAFSVQEHRQYTATLAMGRQETVTFNTDLAIDTIQDHFQTTELEHPHQPLPVGWQQIKVTAYIQGTLLWLRSQGAHVKVIDPPSVVEQLRQDAQAALELYPEQ